MKKIKLDAANGQYYRHVSDKNVQISYKGNDCTTNPL